ncbi:hypothetical protein [Agarivorans sp. Alg241-V36]|uniref:hypothetical protein n=1 Tax=Agarivorans sp. Alg241-V36 TaxID=2305992 RepID=UPI0013D69830|nr:hypothetical protein [Agarivorans sp. Alg241-V36]
MLNQLLALLADLYTPLQAFALLWVGWRLFRNSETRQLFKQVSGWLLLSILISYSLMFADNHWQWWPSFGLDYSTHTAIAFSLQLAIHKVLPKQRVVSWLAYLAYLCLMWLLNYHSVMDMLTTMLSVGLLLQLSAICNVGKAATK